MTPVACRVPHMINENVIYGFVAITAIALILVIYRLVATVLRTLSKALKLEKHIQAFKSWLDQKPDD